MKKLLLLAVLAMASLTGYCQGNLNFANAGAGVNAPITNRTASTGVQAPALGARAAGVAFLAQLYIGPALTAESLLTTNGVSGSPQAFSTGGQAGYFTGGQRIISGFGGGSTITAQVRAWNSAFPSWEAAPVTERGQSNPVQVILAEGATPTPNMIGLQGFDVGGIPEPSSIALGLLGLGAIALFRRRK